MQEYRQELALKAPEDVVRQFEQDWKNDKKIAAIKALREYGVIYAGMR